MLPLTTKYKVAKPKTNPKGTIMKRFIILFTLLIIGGASACSSSSERDYQTIPQTTVQQPLAEGRDDGLVTDDEFTYIGEALDDAGYGLYWTHGFTQTLSEASCRLALEVSSFDELAEEIGEISQEQGEDLVEFSFGVGVIMSTTCAADLNRLMDAA